ncbi:hypothetical protein HAX54_052046 [Datura stramonium]|uniref:Uncharacterized protein n=1 Tax=Datura stramonium TaxID=4076 RepID=A0ABS8WN44_DATST|nr:hypothetical protein [Datura stramonium]
MSSSSSYIFIFCFLFIISTCLAEINFRPKTLFLAVKKDPSLANTLQKSTKEHLLSHLNSPSISVAKTYGWIAKRASKARRTSPLVAVQGNVIREACGDCGTKITRIWLVNNDPCYNIVSNPAMNTFYSGGKIAEDVLTIQSINGSYPGPVVTVPKFIFNCSPSYFNPKSQKCGDVRRND